MPEKILEEILENILENLRKSGFIVESINYPENKRSIDLVGLYNNNKIIIKVTLDAASVSDIEISDLKKASQAYNASSLIISDKYRKKKLDPEVIYEKKGLIMVNTSLFENYLKNKEKPLVYEKQGNYLVKINPVKFRQRRLELGLSMGELAGLIGVTRKAVYNYEHSSTGVSIQTAIRIAEIMGEDVFEPIDILNIKASDLPLNKEKTIKPLDRVENMLYDVSREKGFRLYRLSRTPVDYVLKGGKTAVSIIYYRRDPEKVRVKLQEAERLTRITRSKEFIIRNENDVKELQEHLEEY